MKKAEYLMCFVGIIFVLNWFALWFVLPIFGDVVVKISAILVIILAIIAYILACKLAKQEKDV